MRRDEENLQEGTIAYGKGTGKTANFRRTTEDEDPKIPRELGWLFALLVGIIIFSKLQATRSGINEAGAAISRPPFNAEYLLYLVLRKEERDAVIGDLVEEYDHILHRFDRYRANLWFYKQIICSVWPFVRRAIIRVATLVWLGRLLRRLIS